MCSKKLDGTFYEETSPELTLARYLDSQDNLYDRFRISTAKAFIEKNCQLSAASVLEIGCGPGLWTLYLAGKAASVMAVDIRPHVIEAARHHLATSIPSPQNVTFARGDFASLCQGQKFDFIFVKDVVEHVEDDNKFLNDITKLLKDQGQLFLSTQNSRSLNYLVEGGFNRKRGIPWCGWDPTHLRFYDASTLEKKLSDAGLKPVCWLGNYHVPYRFVSALATRKLLGSGRVYEWWPLHIFEILFGDKLFFCKTGWSIGVLATKQR